jgi:hypothetical protein
MRRVASLAILSAGFARIGYSQVEPHSPAEPDPHENPVDVHAGERDSLAEEPAHPLTVPPPPTPPSKAKPVVKIPALESETVVLRNVGPCAGEIAFLS